MNSGNMLESQNLIKSYNKFKRGTTTGQPQSMSPNGIYLMLYIIYVYYSVLFNNIIIKEPEDPSYSQASRIYCL